MRFVHFGDAHRGHSQHHAGTCQNSSTIYTFDVKCLWVWDALAGSNCTLRQSLQPCPHHWPGMGRWNFVCCLLHAATGCDTSNKLAPIKQMLCASCKTDMLRIRICQAPPTVRRPAKSDWARQWRSIFSVAVQQAAGPLVSCYARTESLSQNHSIMFANSRRAPSHQATLQSNENRRLNFFRCTHAR